MKAEKHIFSMNGKYSPGFRYVCICENKGVRLDAISVRLDTICFGWISKYFTAPNTDRTTITNVVKTVNLLILFLILSPINVCPNVNKIIPEKAVQIKSIGSILDLEA
jgi:hypothetical protein